MLIKVFANGQGGGAAPVDYLIASHVLAYDDNRNLIREASGKPQLKIRDPLPDILSGNPDHTSMLIDSSPHKWSYRAGVIGFDKDDNPTQAQQLEVIEAFEAIAFPGLEQEQFNMLWVRHSHEGRIELHFCTPRLELSSGKSLNIAPPGYQKAFDAVRDMLNKQHGWADPQDPSRAQERKYVPEPHQRAQSREAVQDWIEDLIVAGEITNRPTMVTTLQKAGFEIPRQGKKYLTILDPESDTRWRMKGTIFHEGWTTEASVERETQRQHADHAKAASRLDGFSLQELRERYQDHIGRRAQYNRGRYPLPTRDHAPSLERGPEQGMGGGSEKTGDPAKANETSAPVDRPHDPLLGSADMARPLDLVAIPADEPKRSLRDPPEPPLRASGHQDRANHALPPDKDPIPLQPPLASQSDTTEKDTHHESTTATFDDPTRERIAFLRRRLGRQLNEFNRGTHQLAATLHSLAQQSARCARSLSNGLTQLSGSLQRGFDWLGRSSNKHEAQRSHNQSPQHTQKRGTSRFLTSVITNRKQTNQLER